MTSPSMEYFRSIHNAYAVDDERSAKAAAYNAQFAADFNQSINAEHNVTRNGVRQSFIIVPTDDGCDLWARPGETFNIGDIIYFNTLHWLVTDINFGDSLNRSGKMVRCNRQIRWQNPITGRIITRWCLATKPYTSNIREGDVIANSNREYKIQVGYDEETKLVGLNRRFLLEIIDGRPKAYEVTSVDTITNRYEDAGSGFLVWNLSQHEYNPATDDAELMIADYRPEVSEPDSDESTLVYRITGPKQIKQGAYRKYRLESEATDPTPDVEWRVQAPDSVTWEYDHSTATLLIRVADSVAVGERIEVCAYDANGSAVTESIWVEVIPLL